MRILSTDPTHAFVRAALLAVALAFAGCASTESSKSAPAKAAEPAKQAAPTKAAPAAPAAPVSTGIAAPSGDMGNVVFFRESKFVGAMVGFKVREGEQELGKLSNGTYFVAQVPAGAHAFTVHSEAKDVLNLEVERDQTYYVQGSISMGVMVGRPNLAPADAATFAGMKDKLKDSAAADKKK
jgi:glucose/arabinose dehydrogenase